MATVGSAIVCDYMETALFAIVCDPRSSAIVCDHMETIRVRTFKLSISRLPDYILLNSTRFVKKVLNTLKLLKSIRSGYMLLHLV